MIKKCLYKKKKKQRKKLKKQRKNLKNQSIFRFLFFVVNFCLLKNEVEIKFFH